MQDDGPANALSLSGIRPGPGRPEPLGVTPPRTRVMSRSIVVLSGHTERTEPSVIT